MRLGQPMEPPLAAASAAASEDSITMHKVQAVVACQTGAAVSLPLLLLQLLQQLPAADPQPLAGCQQV